MEFIQIFLISGTLYFFFMGIIWKTSDRMNTMIKTFHWIMFVLGAVTIATQLGYVVKI